MAGPSPITTLSGPWSKILEDLIGSASEEMLLVTPFITQWGAGIVTDAVLRRQTRLAVTLVTDLSPETLIRSSDPGAFLRLLETIPDVHIMHLDFLHAKLYMADQAKAVVTSGNLTRGGMAQNHELGVLVEDENAMRELRSAAQQLISVSSPISRTELKTYLKSVEGLRSNHKESFRVPTSVQVKFRQAILPTRTPGASRRIFLPIIIRAIELHGPMTARRLYAAVRKARPALCRDNITRGNPPRPAWRHEVRFALQKAKEEGIVRRVPQPDSREGLWAKT